MAARSLSPPFEVRRELGLSRERMGRVLAISSKTVERWETNHRAPTSEAAITRFATLDEVVRLGRLVYGADGLRAFLTTPLREFGGRSALQMLEQDEGDRVIGVLAADYEGPVR